MLGCLAFLVLYFAYVQGTRVELNADSIMRQYQGLTPFLRSRDEVLVALIQLLQIVGWVTRPYWWQMLQGIGLIADDHKNPKLLNDASVACACACLLFILPSQQRPGEPLLTWKQAEHHLPWGVLLLMGGGFAMAHGFSQSGLTNIAGKALGGVVPGLHPLLLTFAIIFSITFLTEVTSNSATANIILPLLSAVSWDTLIHPMALLPVATVACSFAFMLPAATPPNSVIFATGRVPIKHFVRAGVVMNLASAILGTFLVKGMASLVFDAAGPFPEWACKDGECFWVPVAGVVSGRVVDGQACSVVDDSLNNTAGLCTLMNGTQYICMNATCALVT